MGKTIVFCAWIWEAATQRSRIFDFTRIMLGRHPFRDTIHRRSTISMWMKANESLSLGGQTLRTILENVYQETKPRIAKPKPVAEKMWKAITQKIKWFQQNSMAIALTNLQGLGLRIVHNAAQSGDWICALPNCALPVVLRRQYRQPRDSEDTRKPSCYTFVGEVYSVEMMENTWTEDFPRNTMGRVDPANDYPGPNIWEVEDIAIDKHRISILC